VQEQKVIQTYYQKTESIERKPSISINVANDKSRLNGHKKAPAPGMRREPAQLPMLHRLGRHEKHCKCSLDKKVPASGTRRTLHRLNGHEKHYRHSGPSVGNEKGAHTAANAAG
jgi:hypothetical protein